MTEIHKYPRTRHLEGSRLQPGDADLDQVPLDALRGRYCVVEEKLDGANAGISLDADSRLRLQSRGHVLVGGAREKHWDLFKRWARAHATALGERVTGGLTIFGEWLYAKHTIFYDQLPHYFLEFDIRDATGAFWSTERRLAHLASSPIVSVPVLWHGVVTDPRRLPELVGHALYKSPRWRERLRGARERTRVSNAVACITASTRGTAVRRSVDLTTGDQQQAGLPPIGVRGQSPPPSIGSTHAVSGSRGCVASRNRAETTVEMSCGVFVIQGRVQIGAETVADNRLAVIAPATRMCISVAPSRVLVLGGASLGPRFIDWNFVASSKDRIDRAREGA